MEQNNIIDQLLEKAVDLGRLERHLGREQVQLIVEQSKELEQTERANNNEIRNLIGEYKQINPDCREGVLAQLERMKELCKERNNLYEKQNDLKGQKQKLERSLER